MSPPSHLPIPSAPTLRFLRKVALYSSIGTCTGAGIVIHEERKRRIGIAKKFVENGKRLREIGCYRKRGELERLSEEKGEEQGEDEVTVGEGYDEVLERSRRKKRRKVKVKDGEKEKVYGHKRRRRKSTSLFTTPVRENDVCVRRLRSMRRQNPLIHASMKEHFLTGFSSQNLHGRSSRMYSTHYSDAEYSNGPWRDQLSRNPQSPRNLMNRRTSGQESGSKPNVGMTSEMNNFSRARSYRRRMREASDLGFASKILAELTMEEILGREDPETPERIANFIRGCEEREASQMKSVEQNLGEGTEPVRLSPAFTTLLNSSALQTVIKVYLGFVFSDMSPNELIQDLGQILLQQALNAGLTLETIQLAHQLRTWGSPVQPDHSQPRLIAQELLSQGNESRALQYLTCIEALYAEPDEAVITQLQTASASLMATTSGHRMTSQPPMSSGSAGKDGYNRDDHSPGQRATFRHRSTRLSSLSTMEEVFESMHQRQLHPDSYRLVLSCIGSLDDDLYFNEWLSAAVNFHESVRALPGGLQCLTMYLRALIRGSTDDLNEAKIIAYGRDPRFQARSLLDWACKEDSGIERLVKLQYLRNMFIQNMANRRHRDNYELYRQFEDLIVTVDKFEPLFFRSILSLLHGDESFNTTKRALLALPEDQKHDAYAFCLPRILRAEQRRFATPKTISKFFVKMKETLGLEYHPSWWKVFPPQKDTGSPGQEIATTTHGHNVGLANLGDLYDNDFEHSVGDPYDSALFYAEHNDWERVLNTALSIGAAKPGIWTQNIAGKMPIAKFHRTGIFQNIFNHYSRRHTSKESLAYLIKWVSSTSLKPRSANFAMASTRLMREGRIKSISLWLRCLRRYDVHVHLDPLAFFKLMREFFVMRRPGVFVLHTLTRWIRAHCPQLLSPDLFSLLVSAMAYNQRATTPLQRESSQRAMFVDDYISDVRAWGEEAFPQAGKPSKKQLQVWNSGQVKSLVRYTNTIDAPEVQTSPKDNEEPEPPTWDEFRTSLGLSQGDVALMFNWGRYNAIIDIFEQSLSHNVAVDRKIFAMALSSSLKLHPYDPEPALNLAARAVLSGLTVSEAMDPIVRKRVETHVTREEHLWSIIEGFYRQWERIGEPNPKTHYLPTQIGLVLCRRMEYVKATELLLKVYQSEWMKNTPPDANFMTVMMHAFSLRLDMVGMKWAAKAILQRDIIIDRVFLKQAREIDHFGRNRIKRHRRIKDDDREQLSQQWIETMTTVRTALRTKFDHQNWKTWDMGCDLVMQAFKCNLLYSPPEVQEQMRQQFPGIGHLNQDEMHQIRIRLRESGIINRSAPTKTNAPNGLKVPDQNTRRRRKYNAPGERYLWAYRRKSTRGQLEMRIKDLKFQRKTLLLHSMNPTTQDRVRLSYSQRMYLLHRMRKHVSSTKERMLNLKSRHVESEGVLPEYVLRRLDGDEQQEPEIDWDDLERKEYQIMREEEEMRERELRIEEFEDTGPADRFW